MNQDNPHARGLDINSDWIGEDEPTKEEAIQWNEKDSSKLKVELTDREGLNLLNPEE